MRAAPFLLLLVFPSIVHAGVVSLSWSPEIIQEFSRFGAAIAPAGDVDADGYGDVIVGAPGWDQAAEDEGRAFLFRGTPSGISNSPVWSWSPGEAFAAAGTAVASAGDIDGDGYVDIAVGVPYWDSPNGFDAGAVFVFKGGAGGPGATPFDTLWYGPDDAHFGAAVAWSGDVNGDGKPDLIVGSPDYTNGHLNEGGITVWLGTAPRYALLPSFALESNSANAQLGFSVSGAGDTNGDGFMDIIAGAPGALVAGHPAAGRAFVYAGANSVSGIGSLLRGLAGFEDSTQVGYAVAGAGDVNADGYADVIIGAPGVEVFTQRGGDAFVYGGSATGPGSGALLNYHGTAFEGRFGSVVGTAGDLDGDGYADVLIGSERYPDPDVAHGRVLIYHGGKNGLTLTESLDGPHGGISFAAALTSAGDVTGDGYAEIVVGGPNFDTYGSAYAWTGRPSGPVAAANTPLLAAEAGTSFGSAVAILPKIDDDPFPSVIIGEPIWDPTQIGRATIYHGQWGSFPQLSAYAFQGTEGTQRFGGAIVDAGDVDRDGYTDFLVASPGWDGGGPAERGKVTLYRHNGPLVADPWPGEGSQVGDAFGGAIAGRGDVNGDGWHDVVVVTSGYDSEGGADAGLVEVYHGFPGGLQYPAAWLKSGAGPSDQFGASVALAGDLDADGFSDMAVGAFPLSGPARVEVYFGSPTGIQDPPGWKITPTVPVTSLFRVAPAGDWNGDGIDDLLACGGNDMDGKGTIAVYAGSRARSNPLVPLWTYRSQSILGYFPAPVGGGDLNGDGYADIAVGVPHFTNGQVDEGAVLVFYGRQLNTAGVTISPDLAFESDIPNALLGQGVALGDLNDDGFSDIVAGAPGSGGRVFAWFGGGEGVPRHTGLTDYLGPGYVRWVPARFDDETHFNAQQVQRSAGGRDLVREEYELQLEGTPFTGIPNRYTNPYGTSPPGPLGSMIVGNYGLDVQWKGTTWRYKRRDATSSPYFPRSRWMTPDGRLMGEYDLKTYRYGPVGVPSGSLAGGLRVSPNPVLAAATIDFALPEAARGSIDVYDVRGRKVAEVARGLFPAGPSSRVWDGLEDGGARAAPGVYFVFLRAGAAESHTRVVLLP